MSKEEKKTRFPESGDWKQTGQVKETQYGCYYPWEALACLNWEQVKRLYVRTAANEAQHSGCYEKQDRVLLVGATDGQIHDCLSMCGDNLRVLELSHSAISEIPEEIRRLKGLRYVGLQGLCLETLPDWLPEVTERFSMDAFEFDSGHVKAVVNLSDTLVEGVDIAIFDQPHEMVEAWFESRKKVSAVDEREVRVFFLGDGESGKSLLIERLMKDGQVLPGDDGHTTPGIATKSKKLGLNDFTVNAHLWNFGAHEIMNSMYTLFMSERALYVIVLNTQDDNQDARARYWLNSVKNFAPNAPVLLVLNKIDQNPNAAINENALRKLYPQLAKVVRVSALKYSERLFDENFIEPMKQLLNECVGAYTDVLPAPWQQLKDQLLRKDKSFIPMSEYLLDCRSCGIDMEIGQSLLRWYNDLGIVTYHEQDSNPEAYIVLDPQWLTNAIYVLLYNPIVGNHNGIISHKVISELLKQSETPESGIRTILEKATYSATDVHYVLETMRRFHFSFPVGDESEFIPMLCNRNEQEVVGYFEQDSSVLEYQMVCEYLPNTLLHRLMMDRYRELQIQDAWFTGAHFKDWDTDSCALVRSNGNTLSIQVRGDLLHDPEKYLKTVLDSVERLSEKMGLIIHAQHVVYYEGGLQEHFNYERLLKAERSGREYEYSVLFDRMIPIRDILKRRDPQLEQKREELLKDISSACFDVQRKSHGGQETEDVLNHLLRSNMWNVGYQIADQRLIGPGTSITGKGFGEVDLLIMDDNRKPWTMVEAMIARGSEKNNLRYWEHHLTKLLINYNVWNLPMLFTVNYVVCGKEKFLKQWSIYREHMRWYAPERAFLKEGSFQELNIWGKWNPYQRIAKCEYYFRTYTVTVYHVFALIDPDASPDEEFLIERTIPDRSNSIPNAPIKSDISEEKERSSQLQAQLHSLGQDTEDNGHVECRVVLIGDSEAGKSQILARLRGEEKADENKTEGIDIVRLRHEIISNGNLKNIWINYWDFGGQEILHSMHRMFLTRGTLYVIVLNTRNDNHNTQADFWLRYVEAYASGAPVLFVLNKIDQNENASLNLPVLNRRFDRTFTQADVLRCCAIVKENGYSYDFQKEFTDKLMECVGALIADQNSFTQKEIEILRKLEEKQADAGIADIDDFYDCCEGVTEIKPQELLKKFQETGVLVYFGNTLKLLLDPKWITEAIYKVLLKRGEIGINGIVTYNQLSELYRKAEDRRHKAQTQNILGIMRKFELSYPYEGHRAGDESTTDREFIPMLCQQNEPDIITALTEQDQILEMQIYFDYLPSGVLYQLMVKYKNTLDIDLVWADGARFHHGTDGYAIVRRDGNVLQIYVYYDSDGTKQNAVEYMYRLKCDIEEISQVRKATANIQQIKVGYLAGTFMEYFDYKQLMNAKQCGVHYVATSGKKPRKIAVQDILDQLDRSRERKTDQLLKDIVVVCTQLQQRAAFMDPQEDVRNNKLLDALKNKEYDISGQVQIGEAPSGKRQNELDFLIRYPEGDPWTIMEALNVSGKTALTYWDKHLNKLVGRYNASWGLTELVLVSYVDCEENNFKTLYEKFRDHMKTFNPEKCRMQQNTFDHCTPLSSESNYLQVDRCTYFRDDQSVTIYHYFARMGENEPPEEKPVD